jgi:hypothetical protein
LHRQAGNDDSAGGAARHRSALLGRDQRRRGDRLESPPLIRSRSIHLQYQYAIIALVYRWRLSSVYPQIGAIDVIGKG